MAGKSAREFNLDLENFGKLSEVQALQVVRKIALDLDASIVKDTPVDEGRARGNWFPSLNVPADDVNEDSLGEGQSLARLAPVIARAKLGDVIWMTNNLPYIIPLENGHSGQAPDGMVDVNVERAAALYGGGVVRG